MLGDTDLAAPAELFLDDLVDLQRTAAFPLDPGEAQRMLWSVAADLNALSDAYGTDAAEIRRRLLDVLNTVLARHVIGDVDDAPATEWIMAFSQASERLDELLELAHQR